MGFWGSMVLGRSREPLDFLPSVRSTLGAAEGDSVVNEHGWRVAEIAGIPGSTDPADLLARIATETGAPAMIGFVLDGDCVDLHAFAPETGLWRSCLVRSVMADYIADDGREKVNEVFLPPEAAARRATAWAVEAGLRPNRKALLKLFGATERDLVAETEFYRMVEHLGIVELPSSHEDLVIRASEVTLEQRLADFIEEFFAGALAAAGLSRVDPMPNIGVVFASGTINTYQAVIGFYPFDPGLHIRAAVLHPGRWWPDLDPRQIALFNCLGRGVAVWERSWGLPDGNRICPLPEDRERLLQTAAELTPVVDNILNALGGMSDPIALIDIMHDHARGNLALDRSVWAGTPPGPWLELGQLFASGPSFALDDAMHRAERRIGAGTSDTEIERAWYEATSQSLQRFEDSESWRSVGDNVRQVWTRFISELVSPTILARGLSRGAHGYELAADWGARILFDLEISAKSDTDSIRFYFHAGLILDEQISWQRDWASRFDEHLPSPRKANFGLFALTPEPPPEFQRVDASLEKLDLRPWSLTVPDMVACAESLIRAILVECDRLTRFFQAEHLLDALRTDVNRFEERILALASFGYSDELMRVLDLAETHVDPYYQDLAVWVRRRLTRSNG